LFLSVSFPNPGKGRWRKSTKQKMRHAWPGVSCTTLFCRASRRSEIGVTTLAIDSTKQVKLLEERWLSFGESKNFVCSLRSELESFL
jgi:hypothetical protein